MSAPKIARLTAGQATDSLFDDDQQEEIVDILPQNTDDSDFSDDDENGHIPLDAAATKASDQGPSSSAQKPPVLSYHVLDDEKSSDSESPGEESEHSEEESDSEDDQVLSRIRDGGATRARGATRGRGGTRGRGALRADDEKEFVPPSTNFNGDPFIVPALPPSPYEAFKTFFTDDVFAMIAKESVEYADKRAEAAAAAAAAQASAGKRKRGRPSVTPTPPTPSPASSPASSTARPVGRPKKKLFKTHVREFSNDDRDGGLKAELERFCGVLIRMGLVQLANVADYWSADLGVNVDNDSLSNDEKHEDRLWKMRLVIEMIRDRFRSVTPEEHHAIDEQMVAFKGRSHLRQCMPKKPVKFGFKVWARAGSSGFVYDFDVYQGKASQETLDEAAASGIGLSSQVVLFLTKGLPAGKGYKIFADNYFSSYNLVAKLSEIGFHYCGTVRRVGVKGAPMLAEKVLEKRGRGTSVEFVEKKKEIVVVQWHDNKMVSLISNYIGRQPLGECRRYDRSKKEHITVERPAIIEEYNKFMGGVDLSDMIRSMYAFSFKCRRWYIYFFVYLLNLTARNAWLYYRRCCGGDATMRLIDFLKSLADDLVKASPRMPAPRAPASVLARATSAAIHLPLFQEQIGECVVCTKKGQRHRSYVQCSACSKILCIARERNCFYEYHK